MHKIQKNFSTKDATHHVPLCGFEEIIEALGLLLLGYGFIVLAFV